MGLHSIAVSKGFWWTLWCYNYLNFQVLNVWGKLKSDLCSCQILTGDKWSAVLMLQCHFKKKKKTFIFDFLTGAHVVATSILLVANRWGGAVQPTASIWDCCVGDWKRPEVEFLLDNCGRRGKMADEGQRWLEIDDEAAVCGIPLLHSHLAPP